MKKLLILLSLLILVACSSNTKTKKEKYYIIRSSGFGYLTKSYVESDGCIKFINITINCDTIKICGTYVIEEHN